MRHSENIVFLGTELKLSINIGGSEKDSPILDMGRFSFKVEVFCNPKKSALAVFNAEGGYKIKDSTTNNMKIIYTTEGEKIDPNSFILLINTDSIGTGEVKCKVTAYLPDTDFKMEDNVINDLTDSYRTEVTIVNTGITIEKSL